MNRRRSGGDGPRVATAQHGGRGTLIGNRKPLRSARRCPRGSSPPRQLSISTCGEKHGDMTRPGLGLYNQTQGSLCLPGKESPHGQEPQDRLEFETILWVTHALPARALPPVYPTVSMRIRILNRGSHVVHRRPEVGCPSVTCMKVSCLLRPGRGEPGGKIVPQSQHTSLLKSSPKGYNQDCWFGMNCRGSHFAQRKCFM